MMPSLPIPVFGALVLGFLFLRMWITQRRLGPLAILLAICGAQALIIALAQHYRVPGMSFVQPVTATFIPPVAWLAFQLTAVRRAQVSDLAHLAAPLAALAALVTAPAFLDVLIPALFVGYGIALLIPSFQGPDAQPRLPLSNGDVPTRIWRIIAIALIASAFADVLIIAAQIADKGHWQPWIISLLSVGNLILIGALSLSGALQSPVEEESQSTDEDFTETDAPILAQLDRLMTQQKPYLNPDLTLTQLSRKMGVPAKTLSAAINRATKENVSRYVNNARIKAAQDALLAGDSVTNAMFSCGFNTKSNFNREFSRVSGTSPSEWLAAQNR